MSANWAWLAFPILVLVYRTLAIAGWILLQRRRGENPFEFAGEISSTLVRGGLILLGPPTLAVVLLLLR